MPIHEPSQALISHILSIVFSKNKDDANKKEDNLESLDFQLRDCLSLLRSIELSRRCENHER